MEYQAEFRIARALASITGLQRQSNGDYSAAQPMLGSLLPLTRETLTLVSTEKRETGRSKMSGQAPTSLTTSPLYCAGAMWIH